LLDIGLPGMDGFEVARQLRKRPNMRETLLVALTGYGQAEDRQQAIKAGFDHHLVKPADVPSLFALIARHCAKTGTPAPVAKTEFQPRASAQIKEILRKF
jgi:CheY-like chemotaxis protein